MVKQLQATQLLLLFLLIGESIIAQPLSFRRYSVTDGLSNNTIYCTAQDKFGFMWFGTEDGLNKFDGYTFHHYEYNPTDTHTIPNNVVRALHVDAENNVWVGTDEGLCLFNQVSGIFKRFNNDSTSKFNLNSMHITAFAEYGDYICIGTNGGGVNIYNKKNGEVEKLYRNSTVPFTRYITALATDEKGSLWIGSSGRGLVRYNMMTKKSSLYESGNNSNSISENYVASLFVGKNNTVWIGTLNSGLNSLNVSTGQYKLYSNEPGNDASLSQNSVFAITEDKFGTLWVGTLGGGLNALNTSTGRCTRYSNNVNNPSSLSNNTVWCVMVERSGTLWIGTTYGLNTYDRSQIKFRTTTIQESLNNNVFALSAGKDGEIWVGILGNGLANLNKYGRLNKLYRTNDGLPSDNITALLYTTNGALLAGTTEGLAVFTSGSSKLNSVSLNNKVTHYITALFEDSQHNIWVGTKGSGVYLIKQHDFSKSESIRGVNNNWITGFEEDNNGNIWIGTRGGGINVMQSDGSIKALQYSNSSGSISSNYINCLKKDHNGLIYVGTYGGGLNITESVGSNNFKHFNEESGLPDNIILSIMTNGKDDVWLSTGNGISNVKKTESGQVAFRNFNELDGLQYKYNNGSAAYLGNNIIVFGGVNGMNIFNPDEIIYNNNKPAVVITSFKLFDKEHKLDSLISLKKSIVLNYDQNFISFEFSGLNYVFPDKNTYAYMLEGSEKDWVNAGNRRYVAYTNLDHGTYRFKVKAANNDGIWNEDGAYITIVINPPFWRTWWFYTLSALSLILFIYLFFQLRTRNLRRANILLESRVTERTRQLSEEKEKVEKKSTELEKALNDLKQTQQQLIQSEKMASLGQLTAGIAHEIKNPLNFVNNFSKISKELIDEFLESDSAEDKADIIQTIQQNISKIHEHGARANNIVSSMMMHARQSSNDKQMSDLNKLLDDTATLAFQGMRSTHIDFNCQIKKQLQNNLPKLNIIQQDVSRVILNLLNNAFYAVNERHKKQGGSYEPTVTVSSEQQGNNIIISIKDNGTGIPNEIREKIFQPFFTTKPTGQGTGLGLSLSYEIIKAHGGDMRVNTQSGSFTEFVIQLPVNNS